MSSKVRFDTSGYLQTNILLNCYYDTGLGMMIPTGVVSTGYVVTETPSYKMTIDSNMNGLGGGGWLELNPTGVKFGKNTEFPIISTFPSDPALGSVVYYNVGINSGLYVKTPTLWERMGSESAAIPSMVHNNTTSKEGGDATYFYHLGQSQYNALPNHDTFTGNQFAKQTGMYLATSGTYNVLDNAYNIHTHTGHSLVGHVHTSGYDPLDVFTGNQFAYETGLYLTTSGFVNTLNTSYIFHTHTGVLTNETEHQNFTGAQFAALTGQYIATSGAYDIFRNAYDYHTHTGAAGGEPELQAFTGGAFAVHTGLYLSTSGYLNTHDVDIHKAHTQNTDASTTAANFSINGTNAMKVGDAPTAHVHTLASATTAIANKRLLKSDGSNPADSGIDYDIVQTTTTHANGTNTHAQIDAQLLRLTYCFKAETDTATTMTNASWTIVPFEDEAYDPASCYNTNGTFTAPVDGVWHFDAHVLLASNAGWGQGETWEMCLYVGETYTSYGTRHTVEFPTTQYAELQLSCDVKLAANATVTIRVYNGSGGNINIHPGALHNFFNGHWVSNG
jgi:hypothetical protein